MEKLEQIIDLLKGLSDEEVDKMKSLLQSSNESKEDVEELAPVEVEEKQEDNSNEAEKDTEATETATEEQKKEEDEQTLEETQETQEEVLEPLKTEQEEMPQAEEKEIPPMQKGVKGEDEDVIPPSQEEIEDDSREFKQIIEAQKAKIEALEAENATLKNKVEGAFGYSSKVSMPTKTNRLYDDCSDVHFHR